MRPKDKTLRDETEGRTYLTTKNLSNASNINFFSFVGVGPLFHEIEGEIELNQTEELHENWNCLVERSWDKVDIQ